MKRASFISWIFGYYVLEIPRAYLEDFLNVCLRYGFTYYEIKIDDETKRAYLRVPSVEKNRILTACRVWQIRVKVKSRHGLAQYLSRYRGRWGLLVGGLLSLALFFLSQSVIWRIDVIGNERLSSEQIIACLAEHGMSVGDFIGKLNTDSIEQRVMIDNDDVAWMSINISGTVASVEIREVIDTEIKEKNTHPANIVALYDAQIVSLEVYSGFMSVKEGDFVRAGELLVSGVYKTEKAPVRYSRAFARVWGRVSHTIEVEIPIKQTKKVPTGEKITKKTLVFFGKPINFFLNYRNLPSSYDIINYVYTFDPFSLGELPISLSVDEYVGYEMCEVEISESEAMEQAYEELRKRIDAELPDAQILKKTLHGEFANGKYILRCDIIAICDIAKQVEFDVMR